MASAGRLAACPRQDKCNPANNALASFKENPNFQGMKGKNIQQRAGNSSIEEKKSSAADISNFLKQASGSNPSGSGRLVFAMDATMSRQPTWDRACQIQASMFTSAGKKSGLAVQLVYFRGYGECRASKWVVNPAALAKLMTSIDCRGGATQIHKVLSHTLKETGEKAVSALVFIGDAVEEDIDLLCAKAGELGVRGVKAFMFQEGGDPNAEIAFREIARLTGGAYMALNANSAKELEELLSAVAAYASGGHRALHDHRGSKARLLLQQMK